MTEAHQAVFLSYASQDAEAARKICDALRAAGVEVWFDQSELRGGDAWDAKIRKQIKECALFVPVISANTQARQEGYFRLEWRLADQRTHLMSHDRAFIVPVVVDGTADQGARVPDSFLAVQWTRLPAGEPDSLFVDRVREMLSMPASGGPSFAEAVKANAEFRPTASRDLGPPRRGHKWMWMVGALAAAGAVVGFVAFRPSSETNLPNSKPRSPSVGLAKGETPNSAPRDLADAKSLVVLPLENLSPAPEDAFFTDGMHSEITATLSRLTDLMVISRNSALAFKGTNLPLREIARQVGVANVMTGSVRRAGNRVRVQLELRRASDEVVLWSPPPYDRELKDVFAIQTEIAGEVARVLQARATAGTSTSARLFTGNPVAFDLFLKANELFFSGSFEEAIPLYEEALGRDPDFFSAAFGLSVARSNHFFAITDPARRTRDAAEAKRWAETASRLMPGGAGDNALVLYLCVVEQDYLRAAQIGERTLRALPNETATPTFYAGALRGLGRTDEALGYYRRALQLDPLLTFSIVLELWALAELRRNDEAAIALGRAAAIAHKDFGRRNFFNQQFAWIRFQLGGELPSAIGNLAPLEQAQWLWCARRFAEIPPVLEPELRGGRADDVVLFALRLAQHDALQRLRQSAAAGEIARELLKSAQRLQAVEEFGPSEKAGWMAQALARNGRETEAIAVGRAYVEAASPSAQVRTRWQREIALAQIHAYLGRPRDGVEILARLLRVPSGLTVPMLRVDPAWDNVREDPGFKALLADPKNSAPL